MTPLRLLLPLSLFSGIVGCAELPMRSDDPASSHLVVERLPVARGTYRLSGNDGVVGQLQRIKARHQDTLLDIARHYDLGYGEIKAANPGVDPWLPGEGTTIVIPTLFVLPDVPRQGLVVNVSAMRLFFFPKVRPGEEPLVITHPIGVGRVGWRTPVGKTKIVEKKENPAWYPTASIRREHAEAGDPLPAVVPPGPDNPLGEYAMRLGWRKYLIHGTNKPDGIGMRVSHGCIRVFPEDIAALYPKVPKGTQVQVIRQPYSAGWRDGQLLLSAHAPFAEDRLETDAEIPQAMRAVERQFAQRPVDIDLQRVAAVVKSASGFPVGVSRGAVDLETTIAAAPRVQNPLDRPTASSEPSVRRGIVDWFRVGSSSSRRSKR